MATSRAGNPSVSAKTVSLAVWVEEEATFLGRIDLNKLKLLIEKKGEDGIEKLDFHGNGYITDAVLHVLRDVLCKKAKGDKYLSQLTTIDLTSCFNITDVGVGWLADIIKAAPNISKVIIDGCTKVTDGGLAAVQHANSAVTVSAMATSIAFNNLDLGSQGCPLLIHPTYSKERTEMLYGNCLVIAQSGLELMFSEYLQKKLVVDRKARQLYHAKDWNVKQWTFALNEMDLTNPLLDILIPSNPTHVMIPFNAAADVKEIKSHIVDVITRVLNKENPRPPFIKQKPVVRNRNKFMDIHHYSKMELTSDGLIKTLSKSGGIYASRQPLSRTNPYYEITCTKVVDWATDTALVIGCMFESLFKTDQPSYSSSSSSSCVEKFELAEGDVMGFGVRGEWLSEYVPREDCSFYFIRNGYLVTSAVPNTQPCKGMYPLLTFQGKGDVHVRLENFNSSQKPSNKEKIQFEQGHTDMLQCDENGILTYDLSSKSEGGICFNKLPITSENSSCTIHILDEGEDGQISLGLGRENVVSRYKIGWTDDTLGLRGEDGKIYHSNKVKEDATVENRKWKTGDKVTISVSGFEDIIKTGNTVNVEFSIGGTKVAETTYKFSSQYGNRCAFMIALHSKGAVVQIQNFRPPFYPKPPVMDKLTMGRANYLHLTDDGTMTAEFPSSSTEAVYMSKTPFNKSLTYFEMEVLNVQKSNFVMGLFHQNYKSRKMGSVPGTVGYHSVDGKMYRDGEPGILAETKPKYDVGDKVGCGLDVGKTKFTSDGRLEKQPLNVYFTKNGTKVYEVVVNYKGNGLYPCVVTAENKNSFKLANYYPHCFEPGYKPKIEKTKDSEKATEGKVAKLPEGCHFVLVSVGSGSGDEKTKLQQVKGQLNLEQDLVAISKLRTEIQRIEMMLGSLDFQGQNNYSRLCWNLECLERVCRQKDRLHFMSVNTKTGEGYDGLLEKIVDIHENHKACYPSQYNIHTYVKKGLDSIVSQTASKVILRKIDNAAKTYLGGSNVLYPAVLQLLHNQGRIVCVNLKSEVYGIDLNYLIKNLFEKLGTINAKTTASLIKDKTVTAVKKDTQLWNLTALVVARTFQAEQLEVQRYLLVQMGVLQLPVLRTVPTDPQFLYTKWDLVVHKDGNLADYWSKGSRPKDTVTVSRTYSFLGGMPAELMSSVLVMCSEYARLQLVLKDGGVLQKGAVQTTIVKHSVDKVDALTVESKCFMPDEEIGPLNEETRYHVEEYTWNVFCILIDIIDNHLENSYLSPIIKEKIPKMLPKTSVGCRHEWIISTTNSIQSVCTMCDQCCDLGPDCKWNRIMGQYLRQCPCETQVAGCKSCGICKRCAHLLWSIRSRLRPCCEITKCDEETQVSDPIALNGITLDSVEVLNIQRNQPFCLKRNDGSSEALIQVFPGAATEVPNMEKLVSYNKSSSFSKQYQSLPGDTVAIKLIAIKRAPPKVEEQRNGEEAVLEIKPVYFSSLCQEVRLWHETGLVCYDTTQNKSGHFVAPKPLSAECNKYSLQVISSGRSNTIKIGLTPKDFPVTKQPGWTTDSVGFLSNGSLYHGSSTKVHAVEGVKVGETFSFELDIDEQIVIFRKCEEEVYRTEKLKIPPGGLFPRISFGSDGECVRILETEPWLPPAHGETPTPPEAFDTCKYGNIWISPGHSVYLHKTSISPLAGWLMFHNPSPDLVGYVVTSDPPVLDYAGQIEPKTSKPIWLFNIANKVSAAEISKGTIEVIWFTLNSGKTYSTTEIKNYLKTLTSEQYHGHLLKVKVDLSKEAEVSTLRKTSSGMAKKDVYELQVMKNDTVMEKYYLKGGNYVCVLPVIERSGTALMRHTKYPTFDLPPGFKKGMRVVVQPEKNGYNECVITSCSADNSSLTVEYTPVDSSENQTLEIKTDSKVLRLEKVPIKPVEEEQPEEGKGDNSNPTTAKTTQKKTAMKADIEIKGYESRGNVVIEKRGSTYPAPYLLTSASRQAILALDSKWKTHSLETIGKCDYLPTRITVQEMQITELSKSLYKWLKRQQKEQTDQMFVFLPSSLDTSKLTCSPLQTLFKDTEVHRLCFIPDQLQRLRARVMDENATIQLDCPIHFVNTPPMSTQSSLSFDVKFGNITSGWAYTSLVATMIRLPVFDKIFSGGKPELPREKVETLLWSLLHMYTASCHILAEQHGGMDLQDACPKYAETICQAIASTDKQIKLFSGELLEGENSLIMHEKSGVIFCKAHQLNIWRSMWDQDKAKEILYEHKHFEPYHDTVNSFCRELSCQKSLPDDFFPKFTKLQYLCLEGCKELATIPAGISKCERLTVVVFMNGAIKNLPEDLFLVPKLDVLRLCQLPVTTLPTKLPASSQLTRLTLKGLQLTRVPPEMGSLKELVYLDLSCNPLVDVPHDLRKLQKLTHLNLSGMPWPTLPPGRNELTLEKFRTWYKNDPYVKTYLVKDMDELFDEHDLNRNGVLDEEELSTLNLKLFWEIPRLGSHCLTDSGFGGIPPAVFQMASLEELYLKHTAVTFIPGHICRLVNLKSLDLENNPLLESLPGSMGHMPNFSRLRLFGCPSLRTPPSEVVSRGFESVRAYLKRLAGGFTACRRTKLMLVGLGGAGKTSLLKALMSDKKKTEGTKGEEITDGIVIQQWKVSTSKNEEITYSAWDFAGQTLYYNTHQFFLSKRAVYMLLWSTRQGFEHAGLDFWLSSIACHAPKTPIFIIGTHCDKVPKADIPMAELTKTYPQIAGFHFISSLVGTGIVELERQLLKVTLEQKNMGEKIPQVWLNLEKKILAAREKDSILPWSQIKKYGVDVGLYDDKDIKEAVEFLHELGTVQYFDNEFLRDQVVINPQWIVNVMSCVVSVKNSPIQENNGRLLHKHVSSIWKQYPKSLHKWLLQLTEEFDLTFPLPKDPVNIVPCLLPQEEPVELDWPTVPKNSDLRQTKMLYKFSYLPAGLFNRAQVRLFQLSDSKLIWKRGSLLKKNNHLALIRQISNFELVVLVQGPRPENILFLVHEVFESLIEESFHGVVYDFMVPCPDCVIKEGCLDPSLFDSKLVYSARDHKAPFLQCRKYFHTVCMSQLIENMPDAQDRDFDASLQHSIMMLQELNNALTTDIAILYSASDMPGPKESGDKIHPLMVKKDLEKGGHSVWMCQDMQNASIQDITLGLKNCKVVVALISENFEKDEKCRTLMLYAMNVLHKLYVILVVGKGMAWTDTDLGMRIGWQELMVMAKTKSRYQEKVNELLKIVRDKLRSTENKSKEYPVCFISYCWCNSKEAVAIGTKPRPGSLGWGDPRALQRHLEENGISTWIDHEQMEAGKGLFENITKGMRYAKVLVACISDEYADSENCLMELRFGVLNLKLPLIVVVVGTGSQWLYSEAAALALRAKAERVSLQEQNSAGYKTIINLVKQRLPDKSDNTMRKEALKQEMSELQRNSSSGQTSVVFKEEYELTQRRFMRHLISFVSSMDNTLMPRLVVVDFDTTDKPQKATERPPSSQGQSGRPTMRPKTASKTRDRIEMVNPEEEDWESERLCIRFLCEYEEGWHLCDQSFPLKKTENLHNQLKKVAPYLARIFAILKQSSMQLNCFNDDKGKNFLEWLDKESQGSDFLEGYQVLRSVLVEHETAAQSVLDQLSRCFIPSGKVFWLCKKHQSGPRITKLSNDVRTHTNQSRTVNQADILLKEKIEKSATYQKKLQEKSNIKMVEDPPKEESKATSETSKQDGTSNDKTSTSSDTNQSKSNTSTKDVKNTSQKATDKNPSKTEDKPKASDDKAKTNVKSKTEDKPKAGDKPKPPEDKPKPPEDNVKTSDKPKTQDKTKAEKKPRAEEASKPEVKSKPPTTQAEKSFSSKQKTVSQEKTNSGGNADKSSNSQTEPRSQSNPQSKACTVQ